MRTLTPAERREIEAIQKALVKQRGYGKQAEPVTITVEPDRNEMWRTVLELALQLDDIERGWKSYETGKVAPVGDIVAI